MLAVDLDDDAAVGGQEKQEVHALTDDRSGTLSLLSQVRVEVQVDLWEERRELRVGGVTARVRAEDESLRRAAPRLVEASPQLSFGILGGCLLGAGALCPPIGEYLPGQSALGDRLVEDEARVRPLGDLDEVADRVA